MESIKVGTLHQFLRVRAMHNEVLSVNRKCGKSLTHGIRHVPKLVHSMLSLSDSLFIATMLRINSAKTPRLVRTPGGPVRKYGS